MKFKKRRSTGTDVRRVLYRGVPVQKEGGRKTKIEKKRLFTFLIRKMEILDDVGSVYGTLRLSRKFF